MGGQAETGILCKNELAEAIRDGKITTVIIAICDMQGRLMGKRLTAEYFLQNGLEHGTHFCNYLLGTDMEMNTPAGYLHMNWANGYGDWTARPDWSTLRVIPWLEKTAMVLADVVDEKTGELIEIAPRSILKKQIQRAEDMGYRLCMASELEFYLFKDTYEEIHEKGYEAMRPAGHYNEDYNLLQATRNEPVYSKFRNYMTQSGIPIEASKGEAWIGQHEVNIRYADALTSADRHVMFKHGIKEISIQDGYSVTFMAKPDHRWTGSSGHIHVSLWDLEQQQNLFYDAQSELYHMSEKMRHFLGGVMKFTPDFTLFFAPNVNSYKRFAPDSWAPISIVWSRDNRSAGFRIVGDKQNLRFENRITGADINPYLAYAAMIAAGLEGIEQQIEPPAEFKGNAYGAKKVTQIPRYMYEAIDWWSNSETVKKLLGEAVANHYEHTARVEQQAYDRVVTSWERARYFEQG
ncbi:glutamine synthetase family protein [Paenactinomyces guangxiensis]|uniref:Glutamine synthetase n=1 Tax=Paenactinomyces guangxiensis TaxID=1490290 RepID=A0A7W1WRE5_9BACL|nr:glutamine synthetase family protein [Paenactinomyces guangxiensis]MBA4494587.1 glutamine synthetase [Paenactinomyces guangxiensis]MBH8591650.1 glutamine synthetase [Paenactinomyces guangxiensis]